ncbi:hypothetical protein KEM55_006111, partial [Ascosphaera atra]
CEERKALRREEGEKGRKKEAEKKEEKKEEKKGEKKEDEEKKENGVVKKDGDGDEKMSDIDEEVAEDGESSLMLDTDVDDDRPPASDANGSATKTADKKRRKGKDDKEKQGKPSKTKPPSHQQQQQETTSKPTTPTTTGPKSKAKERAKARELEREKEKRNKASAAILQKISEEKSRIKSLERRIADLDDKLRENDTARIRCLGTDRFWNRYYWFERNGLPYAGRAGSSTAAQGYANGRLWVLGPDERSMRQPGLTVDRGPEAQPPVRTASPPTGALEHPAPADDSARQLDRVARHGREDACLMPPTVSVMHADAPASSLRDQPGQSPWDRYAAMSTTDSPLFGGHSRSSPHPG